MLTLGATIARLDVPDRHGRLANVVLGHADASRYARGREYFGAVVGRLANRLAYGRLQIDTGSYQLSCNDGPHHLHGGWVGFDKQLWQVDRATGGEAAALALSFVSRDGEEGYPGTVTAITTYTLSSDGALRIELEATTDAPTVVNLTNHSYFNLAGEASGDVLTHRLQIDADAFLAVDETLIPTGERRLVGGTPFDFREPRAIGEQLRQRDEQLDIARGFDHCCVLHPGPRATPGFACRLVDPHSQRSLEVWTDRPGVQFYSGNFLDGSSIGPGDVAYGRHAGLCLETQHFPDAPHHASFPSVRLLPGETYRAVTILRFGV